MEAGTRLLFDWIWKTSCVDLEKEIRQYEKNTKDD